MYKVRILYYLISFSWKLVHAKNLRAEEMPLVLKRAKIVLDLAMPGPERISGEGALVGAIPVISNRWNGASTVDFHG